MTTPMIGEELWWDQAPDSGRRDTLVAALKRLHIRTGGSPAHIVEIGTTRNLSPAACHADGWATRVFAWYAMMTESKVTTVDNRPVAIGRARSIVGLWREAYVEFVTGDARKVVQKITEPIDLLYMDGPSDAEVHLDIYRNLATRPTFVLWDDIVLDGVAPNRWPKWPPKGVKPGVYATKGELAIPEMIQDGYRILWEAGRQVLMVDGQVGADHGI